MPSIAKDRTGQAAAVGSGCRPRRDRADARPGPMRAAAIDMGLGPRLAMPMDGAPGDDRTAAVEALLVRAGQAHGEFEATELHGVYDQEWPRWYATYAVEHGLGGLVGYPITIDRLAAFLASSNAEYERIEPERRGPWTTYTARRITTGLRLGSDNAAPP